jgi:hypothetical protein
MICSRALIEGVAISCKLLMDAGPMWAAGFEAALCSSAATVRNMDAGLRKLATGDAARHISRDRSSLLFFSRDRIFWIGHPLRSSCFLRMIWTSLWPNQDGDLQHGFISVTGEKALQATVASDLIEDTAGDLLYRSAEVRIPSSSSSPKGSASEILILATKAGHDENNVYSAVQRVREY